MDAGALPPRPEVWPLSGHCPHRPSPRPWTRARPAPVTGPSPRAFPAALLKLAGPPPPPEVPHNTVFREARPSLSPRAAGSPSLPCAAWPGTSPHFPRRQVPAPGHPVLSLNLLSEAPTRGQGEAAAGLPACLRRRTPSTQPPSSGLTFFSSARWTGQPKARGFPGSPLCA